MSTEATHREKVREARMVILRRANRHKVNQHRSRPVLSVAQLQQPILLGPREWQKAVSICRRFNLADEDLIAQATGKEQ